MLKNKPVNPYWQMILVLIPIAAYFAFYRINKLRKGLLLALLELGFVVVLSLYAGFLLSALQVQLLESEALSIGVLIEYPTYAMLNVYFVRRWSIQWNAKFNS
ncbi:MAG: hypothetical protein ACE5RJ_02700 [Nitrosopumilaceae archaeon]